MKPNQEKFQREIRKLRKFVDEQKGPATLELRLAYFAETLLRWAIEKPIGWNTPMVDVQKTADLIRSDQKGQS